ncbi:MAG: hypothetical protein NZ703_04075 [Gemmataceae bacterium]|nr:hypothetical protein [Gemmataceae bacterium]
MMSIGLITTVVANLLALTPLKLVQPLPMKKDMQVLQGILTAKGPDWLEFLADGEDLEKMQRYFWPKDDKQLTARIQAIPVNSRVEIRLILAQPGRWKVVDIQLLERKTLRSSMSSGAYLR